MIVTSFSVRFDDDRPTPVTHRGTSYFSTMGKSRAFVALAVAMAAQWVCVTDGHVALTFPAARQYDLDFLDNLRTKAPCGMPKGKD